MNLLTKKTPWIAASLVAAASVFGQTRTQQQQQQQRFNQGYELGNMQMMAGYNAPARIDVRGSWDFYFVGSFTYWQPIQDNMELGVVSDQTALTSYPNVDMNGNVLQMDFGYKPGFKVGIGMNFDHDSWDTFAQYTWFRGTTSTSSTQSTTQDPVVNVIFPRKGAPSVIDTVSAGYSYASQSWTLNMDLLDWELARSEYVGKNLTFRPFFAARAAWIRQRDYTTYRNQFDEANQTVNVTELSNSWAVGPRAGVYTNWILGEGFRLYGNGGADILFTRYTKLSSETALVDAVTPANNRISHATARNVNALRTHLDLELGLGWGTYFDNSNWHVDLSAGYGFQVFFNQNMFRNWTDGGAGAQGFSTNPSGDLYIHGLTANVRFDF